MTKNNESNKKKREKHSHKRDTSLTTSSAINVPEVADELVDETRASHPIEQALLHLLRGMDDFHEAVSTIMPAITKVQYERIKKAERKLEKFSSNVENNDEETLEAIAHGAHEVSALLSAVRDYERLKKSQIVAVLERSLFIGLFSEYDAFIGHLLKAIYSRKPHLYKSIKREITLTELLQFESLDTVKLDMLDKEIDSFRRDGYADQFLELEKKFDLKLRDFPEWPAFLELSQRRNLMTHNGGVVSEQYLTMCDRVGYAFNVRPTIGDVLELGPDYFYSAIETISKVSYMLTHTLWRKVLPDEFATANDSVNEAIYDLLRRKRWKTAAEFGQFALKEMMIKGVSEITRRIRVVNTAIALKRLNKKEEVAELLNSTDWTACVRDFRLACAVLSDDYPLAAKLMRDIGKRGEMIDQVSYYEWPLFSEFRDSKEFQDAYESIYGVPFLEKATETAQAKAEEIGTPITGGTTEKNVAKRSSRSKTKDGKKPSITQRSTNAKGK